MVAPSRGQKPKTEQVEYGRRLRKAFKMAEGETPKGEAIAAMVDAVNVSRQAITMAFKGERTLGAAANSKMARHACVDPDWLATGDGEMESDRAWPFLKITIQQWRALPLSAKSQAEGGLVAAHQTSDPSLARTANVPEGEVTSRAESAGTARTPMRSRAVRQ